MPAPDIIEAVLQKRIEHHESDDDTLYMSAHGLNYEAVKPIRQRALAATWQELSAATTSETNTYISV